VTGVHVLLAALYKILFNQRLQFLCDNYVLESHQIFNQLFFLFYCKPLYVKAMQVVLYKVAGLFMMVVAMWKEGPSLLSHIDVYRNSEGLEWRWRFEESGHRES